MISLLSRNWWALALRGVLAVLFGLAALVWPAMTLLALVLLFGSYAMVDGILSLVHAFAPGSELRGLFAFGGIVGIATGIATFIWPGLTGLTLMYLVAGWAIATGVIEIVEAIRLRKVIENEWLLVATGIFSVIFGVIVAVAPGAGALAMLWVIGGFAFVVGVLQIAFGLRLRSLGQQRPDKSDSLPMAA